MNVSDSLKAKKILLGPGGGPIKPACGHQGFIMPMVLMPMVIDVPPNPKAVAPPKRKWWELFKAKENILPPVQIYTVQTAQCLACHTVFTFGPPPPQSEVAASPPAAPAPGKEGGS